RRAPAAADGRDAVPGELHPVLADPERKPARGGSPGGRPVPNDVRDDPQARHLDDVSLSARPQPRLREQASIGAHSTLASLSQLVGDGLLALLLLAATNGFTAGDRFFDHLPPLTGAQVCRSG